MILSPPQTSGLAHREDSLQRAAYWEDGSCKPRDGLGRGRSYKGV
jgi:hypothetical protein